MGKQLQEFQRFVRRQTSIGDGGVDVVETTFVIFVVILVVEGMELGSVRFRRRIVCLTAVKTIDDGNVDIAFRGLDVETMAPIWSAGRSGGSGTGSDFRLQVG